MALPKGLEHLTRRDWEHVADEGICDLIDRQIIRLYIVGRLPQMVLSFLASQPGFEAWFEANKNKTVGELVGQIGK